MKIGFIGAGKVGFSLGKYFTKNNINVIGYYSSNINSAKKASEFTKTKYFKKVEEIIQESDIIFITTPDSVIKDIWNKIKELSIKNKIICHCSGSLSSNIFSNIESHGAYGYSTHPIYAFSDKYNSHIKLSEATITIEGSEVYLELIKNLFISIGNKVKIISKDNKSLYHAAAVISSNFVVALAQIGVEYLEKCGFNEEEALQALYPLMINNIKNIGCKGVKDSLTGPIERIDIETVLNHLMSIDSCDKELYKLLSKKLIYIAKIKNIDKDYSILEKMIGE